MTEGSTSWRRPSVFGSLPASTSLGTPARSDRGGTVLENASDVLVGRDRPHSRPEACAHSLLIHSGFVDLHSSVPFRLRPPRSSDNVRRLLALLPFPWVA
jgi:hypothetical protein